MKTKEPGSKMWYWIVSTIIVIAISIGGYFTYQKYNSLDGLNAKIAEKDAIIATQQTIIEGNQKTIEANNIVIANKDRLYKSLKDKLAQYIKDSEAIQKPVGEKAITDCIEKHGFKVEVKK